MKFILNTAVDPHFCALFDENNELIERREWTNRRMDGREVFEFLNKFHLGFKKIQNPGLSFTFLGGVAGPGGFSSLRAGAGVLNALSFSYKLPVHQVRADRWIQEFLRTQGENAQAFVLNSFSDGVFISEGENPNAPLQRVDVNEAVQRFSEPVFVGLLPIEKQKKFSKSLDIPFENTELALLTVLEKTNPQEIFLPDYEFPPV
ncbi:hypothetical protein K9L27_03205 [Candidatus Gracilibacteria bacterium]|nr:hypothetical protein [Candidatus Gracilibacteria bacterium]